MTHKPKAASSFSPLRARREKGMWVEKMSRVGGQSGLRFTMSESVSHRKSEPETQNEKKIQSVAQHGLVQQCDA
jgi:hypothetical protein